MKNGINVNDLHGFDAGKMKFESKKRKEYKNLTVNENIMMKMC